MSDTATFKELPLTNRQHNDPDKHLIGDSIGVASLEDISDAGFQKSVGDSPFPARSDHSHDTRMRRCTYTSTAKSCPGGGAITEIDTLIILPGDEDWLEADNKTIKWPIEGVYLVIYKVFIDRSAGVFPANTRRIIQLDMDAGTGIRTQSDCNLPEGQGQEAISITERIGTNTTTTNIDMRHQYVNHDTVAHNVIVYCYLTRLCSTANALEA